MLAESHGDRSLRPLVTLYPPEVEMDAGAQFRDQPVGQCQPHSGCVFPSQQTNLKTPSPISQEVCLLGSSRPFQVSH